VINNVRLEKQIVFCDGICIAQDSRCYAGQNIVQNFTGSSSQYFPTFADCSQWVHCETSTCVYPGSWV